VLQEYKQRLKDCNDQVDAQRGKIRELEEKAMNQAIEMNKLGAENTNLSKEAETLKKLLSEASEGLEQTRQTLEKTKQHGKESDG
jgi:uncharacterized coiled-coil DUF342 family protein